MHGAATRERKCVVSFSMGARWEARAPVMKLKSRLSRDVLLRWRVYTPRRVSFKDSRAASQRSPLHASTRACTRRRKASASIAAFVLRNFELGFNEANDTACGTFINSHTRQHPDVCTRNRREAI